MSKKLCPLLVIAYPHVGGDDSAAVCLEERCAWYDHPWRDCAILSRGLREAVADLRRERREARQ